MSANSQFGLLRGIVLLQFAKLVAAFAQLAVEQVLGQLRGGGALLQEHRLAARFTEATLKVPGQAEQRHTGKQQADQQGQRMQGHGNSRG